jgi:hypothetical protein
MADHPEAADTQRRARATVSGDAWRRAEHLEGTLSSFIFKSMIGTAILIAIPPAVVWLLFGLIRWLVL